MRIVYDLTREDYWGLNRFHLFHSRRSRLTQRWFGLLLFGWLLFNGIRLGLDPVAATLGTALLLFALAEFTLWNLKRKMMKFPAGKFLGETTLEIDDTGITVQNNVSEGHHLWRAVFAVAEDPRYIFIYTEKNSSLVIPKRAFPDASAAKQFYDMAVRNWRAVEPAAVPNRIP